MEDSQFVRGDIPMTKSEVRAVSLSKLSLCPGAVFWDVGAGTGSVSVEAGLYLRMIGGAVYAGREKVGGHPSDRREWKVLSSRMGGFSYNFRDCAGGAFFASGAYPCFHRRIRREAA